MLLQGCVSSKTLNTLYNFYKPIMTTGFLGSVFGKITTHNFTFNAETGIKKFEYIKVYHQEVGFILAQIVELTNEAGTITAVCDIIGYRDSREVLKIPNSTISSNSEVYNADSNFIKNILGLNKDKGLYIGLLDNYNMIQVKLNVKNLVTKHLAVLAKTGAGKSYTLGVIVEELIEQGIPCVIIDPHGEYSSLKLKNQSNNELELMHRYDISPKSYEQVIDEYSPNTEINRNAKPFSISLNSLSAQEISNMTPIKIGGTQMGILYNAISDVKKNSTHYDLNDIRANLELINSNAKYGLYACLDFIDNIGVFSNNPIKVEDLVNPKRVTLINLRGVAPEVQQIIVAKLCKDLFEKRKRNEVSPFFLIIEEAHNFCPERNFGESPSSYILRNIASEGRKFGLGLGVVSQRPARVDKNVLSQCNTQIIQKVTNPNDLKAISASAENISSSVVNDISTLAIGTALVVGASAKPIFVDIRVKKTEHGGKSVSINQPISKPQPKIEPPKPQQSNPLINVIKLPINFVGKSGLFPCFLANVSNETKQFNLLVSDGDCKIVVIENNRLVNAHISNAPNIDLGPKINTIFKLIKEKGSTTVSYLFNALNYSFQDVDYYLKSLSENGLITVAGSRIMCNNVIDLSKNEWTMNTEQISIDKKDVVDFKLDINKIKSFLESNNVTVNNIEKLFIKC